MGGIKVSPVEDVEWSVIRERAGDREPPPEPFLRMAQSEMESSIAFHRLGTESELQITELQYIPNAEAVVHKHDDDEVMYVADGELHLGTQVLRAGSSVLVPKDTWYGFKAGPAGLRIILFRARVDNSVYFKDRAAL